MAILPLTYSRPSYVSKDEFRRSQSSLGDKDQAGSVYSGKSRVSGGVPEEISFDKVINGETCSVSVPA